MFLGVWSARAHRSGVEIWHVHQPGAITSVVCDFVWVIGVSRHVRPGPVSGGFTLKLSPWLWSSNGDVSATVVIRKTMNVIIAIGAFRVINTFTLTISGQFVGHKADQLQWAASALHIGNLDSNVHFLIKHRIGPRIIVVWNVVQ